MGENKCKEMQEDIEAVKNHFSRETSNIEMPESLSAKQLFIKTDSISKAIHMVDKTRQKGKYLINVAACAAAFILIFSGYYSITHSPAQLLASPSQSASALMTASSSASAASQSVSQSMPAAVDYTEIRYAIGKATAENNNFAGIYSKSTDRALTQGAAGQASASAPAAEARITTYGSSGVYQTNTQVADIDEADIVKTDGKYIYLYRFNNQTGNSQIAIVRASDLVLMSQLELKSFYATEMYLNGDQLITVQNATENIEKMPAEVDKPVTVMTNCTFDVEQPSESSSSSGSVSGTASGAVAASPGIAIGEPNGKIARYFPVNNLTQAVVYSVSDPQKPTEQYRYEQDGSYVSSRLYEGVLYLISNKNIHTDVRYNSTKMYQMVPVAGMSDEGLKLVPPDSIVIAPDYCDNSYAVVTAINVKDKKANTKAILGMTNTIYMSHDNLFIAAQKYLYNGNGQGTTSTNIARIAVDGMDLSFIACGNVNGTIDGQFSLDERDGYLRVATTSNDPVKGTTQNNLYILDGKMEPYSKVEGLAPGERIYSVRYIGTMGYIVTFRQTDPLFAIDLSDPANPKVVGQLKIPGFSQYLHPLNSDTLIGLGVNTSLTQGGGIVQDGLKLSLFDVSDPVNLSETDVYSMGNIGSYSEALNNHKAFMYYPEKGLIGFPTTIYTTTGSRAGDPWSGERNLTFNGYMVFKVSEDGFKLAGTISSDDSGDGFKRTSNDNAISRAIYLGDTLYTISNGRVASYSLSSFEQLKVLDIK